MQVHKVKCLIEAQQVESPNHIVALLTKVSKRQTCNANSVEQHLFLFINKINQE